MLIDLQLHSAYSDGYLTPTELAGFIARHGVKIAALTDHNTVGGLGEFRQACLKQKIKPITGLEIYVKLNQRRLNLLWFNFDDKNPELHNLLRDSQSRRKNQVKGALEKLSRHGFKIAKERILFKYNHYLPINRLVDEIWRLPASRAKIKRELGDKNPREEDIIYKYLKNPAVSVLSESYTSFKRIKKLRNKIGGQLILNHPGKNNLLNKKFLEEIKTAGCDGLEVLSPHHSVRAILYAQYMCKKLNLISSGGSDFHRFEGGSFPLQSAYQYFKVDSKYLKGIDKIIG